MKPLLIVLHGSLAVVMFLMMLNDFLRGRSKVGIAGVLGIVWVALLGAVWMAAGWKAAFVAFGLSFLYGAITKPLAAAVARKLLGI